MRFYQWTAAALVTSFIFTGFGSGPFAATAQADWGPFETGDLTLQEILKDSSSPVLNIADAKLLTDNDAAFQSKLEIIQNAKKTLRMTYYIFSDDYSSSVFSNELIKAANRGVHVKILVDYLTNYQHLDTLSMLQREAAKSQAGGKIEVSFYNRPSREIMKDIYFLTSDCSDRSKPAPGSKLSMENATQCSQEKLRNMEAFFAKEPAAQTLNARISNLSSPFMSLFLSGLYAKDPTAIKTAFFEGSRLDLQALQTGAASSDPAELEQLKDFGRLLFDAKFKGSLEAKIKLALAFVMYGEQLAPVYQALTTAIPIERNRNTAAMADWKHLTDFTHHKIIIADDIHIQLGGRNIEDSYHTKPNKLSAKYTFMDTDLRLDLKNAEKSFAKNYDRLFNFKEMVATIQEVRRHAPNEMLKNMPQTLQAIANCQNVKKTDFQKYPDCVQDQFSKLPHLQLKERMDQAFERMQEGIRTFQAEYRAIPEAPAVRFSKNDLQKMKVTYIENLPFSTSTPAGKESRHYGSQAGNDSVSGKSIHSLWVQGLQNTCKASYQQKKKKDVIIHQGYVLFPANLLTALGNMSNGAWDCRYVDVTILTNSPETTDLNIINFFARQQLRALLSEAKISSAAGKASFKVFEYKKQPGTGLSLHTKVNVLGDDMILGSANADVRSYFMDTNNGVFIRSATDFVSDYKRMVTGILADSSRTIEITHDLMDKSFEQMVNEDIYMLKSMIQARGKESMLTPQREKLLSQLIVKIQGYIFNTSRSLVNPVYISIPTTGEDSIPTNADRQKRLLEISDTYNSLLMLL